MNSLTFQATVHFHQTRHGRKRMAVGSAPAPTPAPQGRVPRISRLMALAIETARQVLAEHLAFFHSRPEIIKCALTRDDIDQYNLPPDYAKTTDTRRDAFVAGHGDVSVELDALPGDVLRDRIRHEVESRMDMQSLERVGQQEEAERQHLRALLTA